MSNLDRVELSTLVNTIERRGALIEAPRDTRLPTIVHLAASPFLGGPERQMLGLANSLRYQVRTIFLSFAEGGRCRPFLDEARRLGFETICLARNAPAYRGVILEIAEKLREVQADVLLCHGYKPDLLGAQAARLSSTPVIAVSRGWTGVTLKVRVNEILDRLSLLQMDRVVCVSEGQAVKVRQAGVPSRRIVVIRNAILTDRFDQFDPEARGYLLKLFPQRPTKLVGAAGRLSPEKGFDVMIGAAALILRRDPQVGFVLFGEGPLLGALHKRIEDEGLSGRFVVAPFRNDLDRLISHFDLMVLPSYTEGLPNVALEASAASIPIVATNVGGTPEVVEDGRTGYLVPPGDPATLAARIVELLADESRRKFMGRQGRQRIEKLFAFETQANAYLKLFREILPTRFSS